MKRVKDEIDEGQEPISPKSLFGASSHYSLKEIHPEPRLGLLEWFRPGEYERVEETLRVLGQLGVKEFRTGISWADYHTPAGKKWYDWLIPKLSREVNLLPCFLYTPPSLGIKATSSSPPRNLKAYADFLDVMITRFDKEFEWIELWNEPMNLSEWDWTLDQEWNLFAKMIGGAAYWTRKRGKKNVLGGMSPIDPNWLEKMFELGVMEYIDAVGIHGFPGIWEYNWEGWNAAVEKVSQVFKRHHSKAKVWITETGFSTWQHDEGRQIISFVRAMDAPVERMYWYAINDLHPDLETHVGFHVDEREYHFGIRRTNNEPKLLYRFWQKGGVPEIRRIAKVAETPVILPKEKRVTLITGGAGFIGTNLADRLLRSGKQVLLFDNLSRPGVEENWRWISKVHGGKVHLEMKDVRDRYALRKALSQADQVFHFAAQVAVTSSLTDVQFDFENNILGTMNLLEELRAIKDPPPLVFTSTNKVYGSLDHVKLQVKGQRYEPVHEKIHRNGIDESLVLSFHSPYGCSKGAAEQYILDYARTFGLPAVVFRMSCIYGPHQMGTEDQGWVAHFLIRAIEDQPITLYGDGMQVRDILFVEDLVDAFLLAQQQMEKISGQAFNIGGGTGNAICLLELLNLIGELKGKKPRTLQDQWRCSDQRYYVSNCTKFHKATGWSPKTDVRRGVEKLYQWLRSNRTVSIPSTQTQEQIVQKVQVVS
jgi:CDP-paratose 2-epimerase